MLLVIVSGLALGGLYGMTALVYNVMYSTSKVLSFGTGQFAMVGGICTAWLVLDLHWPLWVGFLACLVVRRRVRLAERGDRGPPHRRRLGRASLGAQHAGAVHHGAGGDVVWWGTDPTPFPRVLPQEFAGAFDQKFWLPMILAVLMAVGLEQFYRRSMIGKLFIAMSEDSFAARARGVATDRMRSLSYVLAGVLGALSGFAGGQLTFADFALGTALGLSGFIALAVGGIGSSVGALVGGAILGMLTSLTTHYFGAEYQKTIAIGLLILLLVVRPQGLVRHHPGAPGMKHSHIRPVIVGACSRCSRSLLP